MDINYASVAFPKTLRHCNGKALSKTPHAKGNIMDDQIPDAHKDFGLGRSMCGGGSPSSVARKGLTQPRPLRRLFNSIRNSVDYEFRQER